MVFALSANQAIARIRTQPTRDYVQYFTWEVSGSLLALSALAEDLGVTLTAPSVDRGRPAEPLSDSLAAALELWTPPEDAYERSLVDHLVEHLRLVRTLGPRLHAEHVDDVAALIGRAPTDPAGPDADLERFVLEAGPDQDVAILEVLVRRAQRQRLLVPPMIAKTSAAGAVGPHLDSCYLEPVSSLLR